jgi:plastocyanin
MTLRSAICFSLLIAYLPGANLSGRIEASKGDPSAVWLEPVSSRARVVPAARKWVIDQRTKTFSPHLLAIRTGDSVSFPNHDPFFHNAFSNYSGQVFDTGLYAPGSEKVIVFRRPGVARIFCNIHPTMSAVVVVVDTPHFAVSGKDGAFRIPAVPAGEYVLRVFTERATSEVLDSLQVRLTVNPGEEERAVPVIRVTDAGFKAPPKHKNKFGKDYPAIIVDQYPGKP